MARKYATAPIHVPDTMREDPNCACRFVRCDRGSPYCEVSRLAERAVESSKAEGGPGLSESDALLAAFDAMARFHREEAARRVSAAEAQPTPTKIRSKKQRKLDKAESIASVSGPDWLRDEDPLMEQILEGLRDSET